MSLHNEHLGQLRAASNCPGGSLTNQLLRHQKYGTIVLWTSL